MAGPLRNLFFKARKKNSEKNVTTKLEGGGAVVKELFLAPCTELTFPVTYLLFFLHYCMPIVNAHKLNKLSKRKKS